MQEAGVGALLSGFEVFVSSPSDSLGDTVGDSIELEEPGQLPKVAERVDSRESLYGGINLTFNINIHQGRPNLEHIVDDDLAKIDETSEIEKLNVALLVCRPAEMGRNLRKEVWDVGKEGNKHFRA